jgi:hypothetical protein
LPFIGAAQWGSFVFTFAATHSDRFPYCGFGFHFGHHPAANSTICFVRLSRVAFMRRTPPLWEEEKSAKETASP